MGLAIYPCDYFSFNSRIVKTFVELSPFCRRYYVKNIHDMLVSYHYWIVSNLIGVPSLARLHTLFGVVLPGTSLHRHMALLETIFILQMTPAWTVNLGQRLIKSPKMTFVDAGLASHLIGLDAKRFLNDPDLTGRPLENFVIAELYKQSSWCGLRVNIYHFRSVKGQEVDVVLEDASGRLVGIEVKLSSSVAAKHFSGLKVLRELAGKRWIAGVVLYTGQEVVPFGDKLWAAPISTLWE
jgi:uncharacterized protein